MSQNSNLNFRATLEEMKDLCYADDVWIGFDAYRFVLIFKQTKADSNGHFQKRIVLGPDTAKSLFEIFKQAIHEYQNKYEQQS